MKKFILPIILLLTVAFFLPQKVNAQTDSECFKEYQKREYKCLQEYNKCIYSCSVEDYKSCTNKCSAQDKTCSEQASVDLTTCKAAIKKDNKSPTETEESPEVEINTDCHETFNQESNSCLKESTKCINPCVEKGNAAMSLTIDGAKVSLECQRNVCDPASEACNNKAKVNFKACQDARKEGQNSQKDKPKQEEFSLLKFFGINPFETWLRVKSLNEVGEAVVGIMDGLYFSASSIDIEYEEGMSRVVVDSTSLFGADLTMRASGQIEGAQIKLPGQSEYQNLEQRQNIPHEAIIRIDKSSRFDIGGEDIEVGNINKGDPLEFQVKKSKENESVDFVELPSYKMSVKLGRVLDKKFGKPSITPEVEEKAWGFLGEKDALVDVPETDNVKIYSWDADSGAVIKSSDWQQTEIKTHPVQSGGFITREVQFKQGNVEVKVRNESVPKMRFSVKSPDFLEAVSNRTHYLVSYDKDTKQNTVVVYEGKVEVKTNDGKTIAVEPKDGKPGMVVVTKELSVVKLILFGLALAVVTGGAILILRRKFASKGFGKKKR